MLNNVTNLFQVLHHLILTAIQYAAEELGNLFVIEVIHILNHSWEEKLHCQVQISSEFVCKDVGGILTENNAFKYTFYAICVHVGPYFPCSPPPEPFVKKSLMISVLAL